MKYYEAPEPSKLRKTLKKQRLGQQLNFWTLLQGRRVQMKPNLKSTFKLFLITSSLHLLPHHPGAKFLWRWLGSRHIGSCWTKTNVLTPKSPSKQCGEKINLDEYQRPNQRPRTKSHPLSLKISEKTLLRKKIITLMKKSIVYFHWDGSSSMVNVWFW